MNLEELKTGFSAGKLEVRPLEGLIIGPEAERHVQPKAIDVLLCLAQCPFKVVSRVTILDEVWGPQSVVGDEVLNQRIHELRDAFRDCGSDPHIVKTAPRRGYALNAEVSLSVSEVPPPPGILKRLLLVLSVLFVSGILYFVFPSQDVISGLLAKKVILVGPPKNLTQKDTSDALLEFVRIELSKSHSVQLLSMSDLTAALQRKTLPADTPIDRALGVEIALRDEDVRAVLVLNHVSFGTSRNLGLELVDPLHNKTVWSESVTVYDDDQVLVKLGDLVGDFRKVASKALKEIDDSGEVQVTTESLEALRHYSKAIRLNATGQSELAQTQLRIAIDLDPEFAMAHAKLGTFIWNVSGDERLSHYHWKKAIQHASHLTDRENLFVQASLTRTKDPDEMERKWLQYTLAYPNDAEGHHQYGAVLWYHKNQYEEAERVFFRAKDVAGARKYSDLLHLGYCLIGQGKIADGIRYMEESYKLSNDPINGGLADGYIAAHRYDDADRFIDEALSHTSPSRQRDTWRRRILYYFDQGQLAEALSAIAAARDKFATDDGQFLERMGVAELAVWLARLDTAKIRELLDRLIDAQLRLLPTKENTTQVFIASRLAVLGKVAARNGYSEKAEKIHDSIAPVLTTRNHPNLNAYAAVLNAELLVLKGLPDQAVSLLSPFLHKGDHFQVHDTLARAYEVAGNYELAAKEYQWMIDNRGRPFTEYLDGFYNRELSVLDWHAAHVNLARNLEAMENQEDAAIYYRRLTTLWTSGDQDLALVSLARARLQALGAPAEDSVATSKQQHAVGN